MGDLEIIELPALPIVTLAEAKAFMRVDTSASDDTIAQIINAVGDYLDGYNGIMGRALRPQRWRALMPTFPVGGIKIPLPPTISVDAVAHVDEAGTVTVMDDADYRAVTGATGVTVVYPAYGIDWPVLVNTTGRPDAVRVEFTAGHQDLSSPTIEPMPENIRLAVLMLCRLWYDDPTADVPDSVSSLIAPYRRTFVQ